MLCPIYANIWYKLCPMKDDKERNYFSLRTMFWKCLLPMLKCVRKMHHKNWTFQWQKVYKNVIHWTVASNALARIRIVTHFHTPSFSRKIILYETNIFYSLRNKKCPKLFAFQRFCMETRLSNILKITKATKFIKTILESTYKVVLGKYSLVDPTRSVSLLRAVKF